LWCDPERRASGGGALLRCDDAHHVGASVEPGTSVKEQQPIRRSLLAASKREGLVVAESVYKVIELVGTSGESWEKAASAAVATASESLRDLRVAEVVELDLQLEDGKVNAYRARVKVSFKYEGGD
jgi:dodecin